MGFKFIHTADLHLGYRQYGIRRREDDLISAAEQIVDAAKSFRADAVLVSGDVFDSPRPPASAVQAFKRVCTQLAAAGVAVYTIDGNHDSVGGRWSSMCGAVPIGQSGHDGRIAGIDYCSRQQLFDRLEALAGMVESGEAHPTVLMLHMEIAEMAAYSTAVSIDEIEPYMDRIGARYVALGHIHNRVVHRTASGRVYCYPGSTEVNDTSEVGVKTVEVVEIGDDGRVDMESATLKTRPFRYVDIASSEDLETKIAEVNGDPDAFWLVKVDLSADGELVKRIPDLLHDRLYRLIPYGSRHIEKVAEAGAQVAGLKDAITQFFEPESEETQLIARMIEAPDQVKTIATEYVDGKMSEE